MLGFIETSPPQETSQITRYRSTYRNFIISLQLHPFLDGPRSSAVGMACLGWPAMSGHACLGLEGIAEWDVGYQVLLLIFF
jgi:hypothetical protein